MCYLFLHSLIYLLSKTVAEHDTAGAIGMDHFNCADLTSLCDIQTCPRVHQTLSQGHQYTLFCLMLQTKFTGPTSYHPVHGTILSNPGLQIVPLDGYCAIHSIGLAWQSPFCGLYCTCFKQPMCGAKLNVHSMGPQIIPSFW